MEEDAEQAAEQAAALAASAEAAAVAKLPDDEGIDMGQLPIGEATVPRMDTSENQMMNGTIRTLDGEIAGDELEGDAINYQILLGKIDALLERLKLDA